MSLIKDIELAMLAQLQAISETPVLPFKFYSTETAGDDWEKAIAEKRLNFPGAWVVYGGCDRLEGATGEIAADHSFILCVADRHATIETVRRHGSAQNPGSYKLVELAIALLDGFSLGLDISPLEFQSVRPMRLSDMLKTLNINVYALHFTVEANFSTILADPDLSDDRQPVKYLSGWDLAPSDGSLEATDTISFPPLSPPPPPQPIEEP